MVVFRLQYISSFEKRRMGPLRFMFKALKISIYRENDSKLEKKNHAWKEENSPGTFVSAV